MQNSLAMTPYLLLLIAAKGPHSTFFEIFSGFSVLPSTAHADTFPIDTRYSQTQTSGSTILRKIKFFHG
jgi:hypothetical protein